MDVSHPISAIDKRYQIEAKLGQGASGVVYRVFDTKLKRRVAIKLLRADPARQDGTHRFEREFNAISRLHHPNIISVYELSKNYFTMEYVEGAPLNPHERRDFHTTIQIAIDICRALRYIHSQGIVHGDLKPAHILMTPGGALRLIDFGLSEEFNPARKANDPHLTAAGTLEYMAPERAKGMGIDPRSDLYALGILLYELCTGRPPFTDTDPMALVMKQIEAPPPPPRAHNPQVPRDLERLILRLLDKEPSARIQSADEALSALTHLIGRREVQESRIERGSRHLFLPRFVGREREIARLEGLFRKAAQGEGVIVLVHGEQGVGCSRLVGEFGAPRFFGGAIALNSTCEPAPPRPYAAFGVLAELGLAALEKRGRPEQAARLTASAAAGLARLSPAATEKGILKGARPALFADPRRLARDLAALLAALADIEPVLAILEDIHWLDRLSCQVLEALARHVSGSRILLCLTAKDPLRGEVTPLQETLPMLARLPHWNDIPLQPLPPADLLRMAGSMLGRASLDPPLAPRLVAAARGNPLVAQETVKALADQGIIFKRGGVWQVDSDSLERVKPSQGLEDWLLDKIHHLDAVHQQVLAAAALIGRRITFGLLRRLTRVDRAVLHDVVSNLARERLLFETEVSRQRVYALPSERLRKTVYKMIDEKTRWRWHREAAEALTEDPETNETALDDIAHHYRNGASPEKALPYLLRSAERAAGLLAHAQAIESFNAALRVGEETRRFRDAAGILLRIGEIFLDQDNRVEARRHLADALERSRRDGQDAIASRAHLRLAELDLREQSLTDAERHLDKSRALYEALADALGLVQQTLLAARLAEARGAAEEALALAGAAEEAAAREGHEALQAQAALARGRLLNALSRHEEALRTIARAERLFALQEQGEGQFACGLAHVTALLGLGQPEEAAAVAETWRADVENMRPPLRVEGFLALARLETRLLQLGAAETFFDRAFRAAEDADDPLLLVRAHREKANAFLSQTQALSGHRRREAVRLLKQAEDLAARAGLPVEAARIAEDIKTAGEDASEGDASGLRRERDELRFLQQLSATVNSELDLERLLNLIMDMVIQIVKAERGFLLMTEDRAAGVGEPPPLRIAVARNVDQEAVDRPEFKISHTIAQRVVERREPILTRDAQTDERFRSKISVLNLKLRSILCVPLLSKQKVIGAVYIDNRFVSEQFNEDNLRLLVAFADQAAIAVENARLHQDNLRRQRDLEEANRSIRLLNEQLEAKMLAQGRELAEVREVLAHSQKALAEPDTYHSMRGKSEAMRRVFRQIERLKGTDVTVLIQGESGTGKELVAHLIHAQSPRADRRFLSENCAAISPTLLESELFGHVRGAFTGAVRDKKGLFESADRGTLFLDEIGEMSLDMQAKLLRVLENGEVRPVGATAPLSTDVRIIAATNRDLKQRVQEGKFREDLFYRLNVVQIALPPLRDRREDIPLLLAHFLRETAERHKQPPKRLSGAALRVLMDHAWPGNVRELRSVAERMQLLSPRETVEAEDIALVLSPVARPALPAGLPPSYKEARRRVLDDFNRGFLAEALARHGGNVSATAREIGIERQYLHKILKTLNLSGHGEAENPA